MGEVTSGAAAATDATADVPADVVQQVRAVPAWAGAELTIVELHGGITNRNYRVDVGDNAYVVRIPGESTELLGIDRGGELEAATRAAELGIGPAVFGALPGHGTVITGFVSGSPLDAGSFLDGDRIERVVDAIVALHGSGALDHHFPIFRIIERHAVDAVAHGAELPADYDAFAAALARIEQVFVGDGVAPVPCHNDLLPANVLADGDERWLIDFEYAGMNEAMFDLANLSVNGGFDSAADDRLLTRYLGGPPSDGQRARLSIMKVASELREGTWALVQQGISRLEGFDFGRYGAERLASCRDQLASPGFANAIVVAESTTAGSTTAGAVTDA